MGTSVISGKATGIVISTGFSTYLGNMGKQIDNKKDPIMINGNLIKSIERI